MNARINDTFQDTLIKVNQIFNFINEEIFKGELPELLITIESDKKKGKVAGWYQSKTYWKYGNESVAQMNICAERLCSTWLEISETILHEAVHLYCYLHGVPAKNNYHNIAFKEAAESFGLVVQKAPNGWSRTSLNDTAKEKLTRFLEENHFATKPTIYREAPPPKAVSTERRPKAVRFKCPGCDVMLSTSCSIPFECPMCKVQMIEVTKKKKIAMPKEDHYENIKIHNKG
jgi:hypothetical protein